MTVDTGLPTSTVRYLETRIKSLSPREKLVSIVLDEVYSAQRIEFQSGKFYGLENEEVTKTLLCLMLNGVAGKYQDIVAMVPLTRVSSTIINTWYIRVLEVVTKIGFDVVATSTDGHSANRKFYSELGKGKGDMPTYIMNPYKAGSRIFLLFDSVHIFKNVFNNFLNRKNFKCPAFGGTDVSASFHHVEELYQKEKGNPIKYAHKLSDKVIAPKPIERTKVELADRFFHDSTIAGLEHFCQEGAPWQGTANFLKLIRRFWNCVNVRNSRLNFNKRDNRLKPISVNERSQVEFMNQFSDWLDEWESFPGKTGLSQETFLAIRQTSVALKELALYLMEVKGLLMIRS
jgi:hypothetical protein